MTSLGWTESSVSFITSVAIQHQQERVKLSLEICPVFVSLHTGNVNSSQNLFIQLTNQFHSMTQQSFQPHPQAFQSHGVPSSTSNRNQVRRPQKTALFLSSPDVTSSSGFIHSTISSTNELISSTTATPTTTTFEPIMPDTTALAGFASIVLVCVVAGWYGPIKSYPFRAPNWPFPKRMDPSRSISMNCARRNRQ